jgi:hypothetical protein
MFNIQMGSELIFRSECNITLSLAHLIRTYHMALRKMNLQVCILFIVNIFVVFSADVASQMVSIQMLEECQVVEVELLAEVTVGVRQYLAVSIVAHITKFYMFSK